MTGALNEIDVLVGGNIKAQRVKLNLTIDEIATELGVDVATLEDMEAGRLRVSALQIRDLCDLLRMSPASIYQGLEKGS